MSHAVVGLDHVALAAPPGCERKAREFFGEVVGLDELVKPDALADRGGVWFVCGDQQLHIGADEDHEPARKAHPAFAVRELDALEERLVEAGHETRPDASFDGRRRFHTDDPFGNRLEFVEAAE